MSARKAGSSGALDEMSDLLSLPDMDPARVQTLRTKLNVKNCAELKRALAAGRVVGLRGFSRELNSRLQAALAAQPDDF